MKVPFTQLLQAGAHFAPANGVAGLPAEGMPGMPGQQGLALHGGQPQGAFIDQVMGGIAAGVVRAAEPGDIVRVQSGTTCGRGRRRATDGSGCSSRLGEWLTRVAHRVALRAR